jgi:hypothetical protein
MAALPKTAFFLLSALCFSHGIAVARTSPVLQASPAATAPRAPTVAPASPGSSLVVSVITIGQGDLIWEKFGHNGLRIRDTVLQTDVWYNWGLFNPNERGFLLRFLQGRMRYSMAGEPVLNWLRMYAMDGRAIWEQRLALTDEQKLELQALAQLNDTEPNRYYSYNYYLDNCSTRVRDILNQVIDGRLRAATEAVPTGNTFRGHTRRLLADSPVAYFGIQLVLGHNADRPISRWEEMFLPVPMMQYLTEVQVRDAHGELVPLAEAPRALNLAPERSPEPASLRQPTLWYLAAGVLLAGVMLLSSRGAVGGGRGARKVFSGAAVLWCAFAGVAGTLALAMWLFSEHTFMYNNETVLLLNPLLLPLVFLLRGAVARGSRARATMALCSAVAGLSAVAVIMHVVPGMGQENPELVLLALAPNLALWVGTGMILSRGALVGAHRVEPE